MAHIRIADNLILIKHDKTEIIVDAVGGEDQIIENERYKLFYLQLFTINVVT